MTDIISQGLSALEAVAPTLATMIGGPLAGTAVTAIEGVLGLDKTGDQSAALSAVAGATPDQLVALKQADNAHAETMAKLQLDTTALDYNDRASARSREMAVKDRIPGTLAIGTTLGFFGLLSYLLGHAPPEGSRDVLNVMLGSLGTAWLMAMSYYFGSSNTPSAGGLNAQIRSAVTRR